MPYVTAQNVEQTLANLIANSTGTILSAFAQRGGWENWLQVSLANALNAQYGNIANILREDPAPYNGGNRRVDILITHMLDVNNLPVPRPIAVELKAESIFQAGIGNSIGDLATEDLNKIANYGRRDYFQFMAMSIAVSGPGRTSLVVPYNQATGSNLVANVEADSTQTNDQTFPSIYLMSVRFN